MLDIKLLREKPEIVRNDLFKRNDTEKVEWVDNIIKWDAEFRQLKSEADHLRNRRNTLSLEINKAKKEGRDISKIKEEAANIPDAIKNKEDAMNEISEKIKYYLMRLPNILHDSVPAGKDSTENVVVKIWGKPKEFDFELKPHGDLIEEKGLADFKRATKTAASGFAYLLGDMALLDQALMQFAISVLVKKSYTLVEPPFMMNRKAYEGVTDLADFENVMYKIDNDDLYLIATSEHPMAAMFMDETLSKDSLPLKLMGISPCFRREVGSHGKYTRGIFRVHQFNKIEQFIFCVPEESWRHHEELQDNSESLYRALEIPHRVVNVCTGDIGIIAAKKYDIEAMLADGQYREVGSNSNCTDYQARRLGIKYREKEGAPPMGFVHTLNNTALATGRTMIAMIEANQQDDGTVRIPKALKPYMGMDFLEPLKRF